MHEQHTASTISAERVRRLRELLAMIDQHGMAADILVPIPSRPVEWRPERYRRSRHWPMPDPCADADQFLIFRHRDLLTLDDDTLRDQGARCRAMLWERLSDPARWWLEARKAAIADELQRRRPTTTRDRTRVARGDARPMPTGFQPVRGGRAS